MKSAVVHRLVEARRVSTKNGPRYLAELELIGETKRTFWLSIKQGAHLVECANQLTDGHSGKHAELHVIIDDGRFIWCGIHTAQHSDVPFIETRFGVTCVSPYIGFHDTSPCDAADCLKDDQC